GRLLRRIALFLGVAAVVIGLVATRLPLGFAALDAPDGSEQEPADMLTIRGWAMDPAGVLRVEAQQPGNAPIQASLRPAPDVHRWYPVGGQPVWFEIRIPKTAHEPGALVDVDVVNNDGRRSRVARWRVPDA
ncbi:MAG: hypothetical protein R3348_06575, partial [Xanthomonadales bacterium]|nr:hypothetical protein [Xanthomonadales bacterium]